MEKVKLAMKPPARDVEVPVLARDGDLVTHYSALNGLEMYTITHAPTGRKVTDVDTLAGAIKLMVQLTGHLEDVPTDVDSVDFAEWWAIKGATIRKVIDDFFYQ